jgi:hypothetical protein
MPHEQFLSRRQRYQPIALPPDMSEKELARDWTLSDADRTEIGKYSKSFRLSVAIQLCTGHCQVVGDDSVTRQR